MRLTFAQLEALLDELTKRLYAEKLTIEGYVEEWDRLMVFAGWSWAEFEAEIDKNWTRTKKAASPLKQVFSC